ncbi:MAG: S9 family peptidase [Phycisphaeraceae bacterium]|nr:S9 family peptidase [Phycisphaeraceae bacterium]
MRSLRAVLCCSLLAAPLALAQQRTHHITEDDYFTIATIAEIEFAPDGRHIAYTELRWDESLDRRNTDLWIVDTLTREPTRLTFDPATEGSPRWSPDGQWLYFTANYERGDAEAPPEDGSTQVWRMRPDGSALAAVTREESGIEQYELSRSGKSLYFTVDNDMGDRDEFDKLRAEFDTLEYGDGAKSTTILKKLDLTSWREQTLIDEDRSIHEFAVAPDESRIAMLTTPDDVLLSNEGWSRVDVWDKATGSTTSPPDTLYRAQAPSPFGWLLGLAWSDDSGALAFRIDFDGYPGELFVAEIARDGMTVQKITRPDEVTAETAAIAWIPKTRDLCFLAEDHARARIYCVQDIRSGSQGGALTITPGDVTITDYDFDRTGQRLAILTPTLTGPPEIFVASTVNPQGEYEQVTDANPQIHDWILPQIQIVRWKSDDGTPCEGILELPADWTPSDSPIRMVVELHGGPTSSTKFEFRYWIYGRTLMPSKGWALFSPNYRGSTGYGDKFLIDLIGHKNDRDVKDILSGVDAMVDRGIADPEKLAVMGWSNGGYLTNCVITTTDRFKAASSGAGIFDIAAQWARQDTPGHNVNYQQGLPWQNPQAYENASPLFKADRISTPTLIHVGGADARCPPVNSRGLYRALKRYLDVPTELVTYPGAGHGLTTYTHRKAKMAWDQAWFDAWVLGESAEDEPQSGR